VNLGHLVAIVYLNLLLLLNLRRLFGLNLNLTARRSTKPATFQTNGDGLIPPGVNGLLTGFKLHSLCAPTAIIVLKRH
jgi:hypothetical protein